LPEQVLQPGRPVLTAFWFGQKWLKKGVIKKEKWLSFKNIFWTLYFKKNRAQI
jgi:hypothetical protein